jgi:Tol biopolymer transport system component
MRRFTISLLALLVAGPVAAQIKVLELKTLPLPADVEWLAPRFSPDGTKIFLTSSGYNGIWEFERSGEKLRNLTSDRRSGFGYAIARDGSRIAFRRTTVDSKTRERKQELLTLELATGKSAVQASGRDLSLPAFAGKAVAYVRESKSLQVSAPVAPEEISLLGIENTKIALLLKGEKQLLDPFSNGSYIWPALSPDRTRLVAYEMSRGTFVCDLSGNILSELGRRDAPAWTRDGKWIVFMDQKDDGHRILSSDLYMISLDGKTTVRLTDTPETIELYPQCSPTEDRIVFNTASGEVRTLTYTEEGR